jgi:hypothetical protein
VALYKRVNSLDPLNADPERPTRSGRNPAVENLARESHSPVGDVERLYGDEMAKLTRGARVKIFLSIFALRHIRKMLLNRSVTKWAPVRPTGTPETGHPVLPSDT